MSYATFFKLLLSHLDPERAHAVASLSLRVVAKIPGVARLMRRNLVPHDERLRVRAFGHDFATPIGVAAGFDKKANWYDELALLGFGCIEVGTVTLHKQKGNPRKRVFRAPSDHAVLNAMGFPNPGADIFAKRLARQSGLAVIGVNVGKSRSASPGETADDYRETIRRIAPHAAYVVLNISSPNTPGLREMQTVDRLSELVTEARRGLADAGCTVPLLVKISPDLVDAEIIALADRCVALGVDGIVAVNTTTDLTGLGVDLSELGIETPGGLSGRPLKNRATEVLQCLHEHVGGKLVLISVGGIETGQDVWDRIRFGATLVQVHTGFIYGGPMWPSRLNDELLRFVEEAGMSSIQDAVGTGVRAEDTPLAARVA